MGWNERKLQEERDGENPLRKREEKAGKVGMKRSYRKKETGENPRGKLRQEKAP